MLGAALALTAALALVAPPLAAGKPGGSGDRALAEQGRLTVGPRPLGLGQDRAGLVHVPTTYRPAPLLVFRRGARKVLPLTTPAADGLGTLSSPDLCRPTRLAREALRLD